VRPQDDQTIGTARAVISSPPPASSGSRLGRYPETRFNGPFAEIASALYGREVGDAAAFAARSVVFVELCPYRSVSSTHDAAVLEQLGRTDVGFRMAAEVLDILISEAKPSLILANGIGALRGFEAQYAHALDWRRVDYPSVTRPGKMLWHMQGVFTGNRPHLGAGVPFLRKPQTHNSFAEIRQIGIHLRELGESLRLPPYARR
jgi:hypothetical protein